MSALDAKEKLIATLKDEAKTEALSIINTTIEEAKQEAKQEAKKLLFKQFKE